MLGTSQDGKVQRDPFSAAAPTVVNDASMRHLNPGDAITSLGFEPCLLTERLRVRDLFEEPNELDFELLLPSG